MNRTAIVLARIYDRPEADRYRVLVDALWPRGVRRDDAPIDEWCRAVAPSAELRRWYRHDPDRFATFAERYRRELDAGEPATALAALLDRARAQPVAIVTATRRSRSAMPRCCSRFSDPGSAETKRLSRCGSARRSGCRRCAAARS